MPRKYRVIVTKGKVSVEDFTPFCETPSDVMLACQAEENMARLPKGTQMGCVVREYGASGMYGMDMKLVRDFNLMDKIRFFGLKQALLGRGH